MLNLNPSSVGRISLVNFPLKTISLVPKVCKVTFWRWESLIIFVIGVQIVKGSLRLVKFYQSWVQP